MLAGMNEMHIKYHRIKSLYSRVTFNFKIGIFADDTDDDDNHDDDDDTIITVTSDSYDTVFARLSAPCGCKLEIFSVEGVLSNISITA